MCDNAVLTDKNSSEIRNLKMIHVYIVYVPFKNISPQMRQAKTEEPGA